MHFGKHNILLMAILLLGLLSNTVTAQDSNKTDQQIRSFFNTPYMKFGGYGMLAYQYNDITDIHDLYPRFVFLSVEGKIGDKIRYFILSEFSNPRLFEYYGEWMPTSYFNFRAGQFKVPFSFENEISPTTLESVLNTRTANSLTGMAADPGVNNGGGRDIGVQASGSFLNINGSDLVNYKIGLFQGTGINIRENNKTKDVAGIVTVQPVKGLRLGVSGYYGKAHYLLSGDSLTGDHVRNRFALSAEYKGERLYSRAEWISGDDAGQKKDGIYGTAQWYFVPQKFNAFARVDYFTSNTNVVDYTIGASYFFYKNCRLQLNYTFSDFSDQQSSNNVTAQMQIVF